MQCWTEGKAYRTNQLQQARLAEITKQDSERQIQSYSNVISGVDGMKIVDFSKPIADNCEDMQKMANIKVGRCTLYGSTFFLYTEYCVILISKCRSFLLTSEHNS